jgi:methionine synthase II (cobalamin-independent)
VNSLKKISKEIEIEDLVKIFPESVTFLMEKGIRCLRCGEPIWGTLENAAKEKGFSENDINGFVNELNLLFNNKVN